MAMRGTGHWAVKLTEADVIAIRTAAARGDTLADLAPRWPQVSKPNLHHIVHSNRWKQLPPVAAYRAVPA